MTMPYDDYDIILDDEDNLCDQSHGGLVWDDDDDEDDADWHNEYTEEMDDLGEWFTDEGGLTADAYEWLAEQDSQNGFC